uniref:hypothetical protein n=1 Tax=Coprococcus sp. TaxID=2049024 RepID=UPI004027C6F3
IPSSIPILHSLNAAQTIRNMPPVSYGYCDSRQGLVQAQTLARCPRKKRAAIVLLLLLVLVFLFCF